MKTKEIIKKLEAVVCELRYDECDEPEYLNYDDNWMISTCEKPSELRKRAQFLYMSDIYKYYWLSELIYRIKR